MLNEFSRRAVLKLAGVVSTGIALAACGIKPTDLEIVQPAHPNQDAFAQYAFEMRRIAIERGDQAYGAIIVKDNRVVGLGPSRVVVNRDATAHAEMEALRDASRRLGAADLSGCAMYSTARPCRMCETAAYWAHIAKMIYGANATDAGAPQYCA
ncbi:MAG: nucleoside deaminase [Chloroflexi bacterium]|nr:nucleoside deaminase [Chloroflexota bacterium]